MPERFSPAVRVERMIPILNVRSVPDSVRYYVDVLGFKVDWDASDYASVSLDRHAIMLCQGGQGQSGTWIWIGVEDVEELFHKYTASGAKFRQELTNYTWAYEMRIEDLDGHVLRFGSDSRTDRPLEPLDSSYNRV